MNYAVSPSAGLLGDNMRERRISWAHVHIEKVLEKAGIEINGNKPWDIQIHDERFFTRIISERSLGLGESYMDGWWDCDALDEFFFRILRDDAVSMIPWDLKTILAFAGSMIMNQQSPAGARKVADEHYNLGNDFYQAMLDPYMQYSCGYFKDTDDLATAQRQKLDLICRKLQLKESDAVLDIGCGWGGFAKFAAEQYGCHVTGINISTEQIAFAKKFCEGLPVKILERDYRAFNGKFDKIVSVGMFEHVGYKNYRTYMEAAAHCLKKDGLFLLHTIGSSWPKSGPEPWINKYIFPNSVLPTMQLLTKSAGGLFIMEDWHNFGADYDKTLLAWHRNFTENWHQFKETYGERFERMWRYYLLSCAGSFRARSVELWQVVLSQKGMIGGYQSVR
jgi:cyclopropane-fatty-acyl-phospholipid synthase